MGRRPPCLVLGLSALALGMQKLRHCSDGGGHVAQERPFGGRGAMGHRAQGGMGPWDFIDFKVAKDNSDSLASLPPPHLSLFTPLISQLRLVALNFPLAGDMNGLSGADLQCHRQSQEAQLSSTFRAFLSSPTQNLVSIVRRTDRALPIVNLKGQRLAKTWNSLFGGDGAARFNALRFPIYTFDGRNVLTDPTWHCLLRAHKAIWHGSSLRGHRAPKEDCQGWRASLAKGFASPLTEGKLLAEQRHDCSNSLVVLCVEISFL
uniref:Collagenase NC10/endostatin domain-containing protein n=1 Tax=Gopherus agassizii TaxID=38772 RepID=A0A452IG91_9SAUR